MAARLATVADLPSEFDGVDSRDLTFWMNLASKQISVEVWEDDASEAHALLAAHFLKSNSFGSGTAAAGPISSEGAGPVRVSYAVASLATRADDLATTTYGRALLELAKGLCLTPIAIRSNDLTTPPL